jgi:hypothetical protein
MSREWAAVTDKGVQIGPLCETPTKALQDAKDWFDSYWRLSPEKRRPQDNPGEPVLHLIPIWEWDDKSHWMTALKDRCGGIKYLAPPGAGSET